MSSIYNEEAKAIFIHVHKCAGTSIYKSLLDEKTLSESGWQAVAPDTDNCQLMQQNNLSMRASFGNPAHFRAIDMMNYLGEKTYRNYTSFACVRNPWSRVLSWYRFLKQESNGEQLSFRRQVSFRIRSWELEEFIQYSTDHFFLPQCDWVTNESGEVIVDRVLKLEELGNTWPGITAELFGKELPLPIANKSKSITKTDAFQRVRKSTLEKFREKYADDFALLGYDDALPLDRTTHDELAVFDNAMSKSFEDSLTLDKLLADKNMSQSKIELYRSFYSSQNYGVFLQNKLDEKDKLCSHYQMQLDRAQKSRQQQAELISNLKKKMQRISQSKELSRKAG